jgi:FtsP/CotA-like multicopper oxidase with cupredoxin domain
MYQSKVGAFSSSRVATSRIHLVVNPWSAYATTIHKSEGSEYPAVVIPLSTQHYAMLQRNPRREWRDTVLVPPREAVEIAFVADNPGDWMFHCHVADHQMAGMMTMLRIS